MELYTHDELLEKHFGRKGTARRDKFETAVEEAVNAYAMGEALKQARQQQHLTQEELGNRIGVKRAQISKIEKGKNLTLSTITRIFHALNIPATINVPGIATIVL